MKRLFLFIGLLLSSSVGANNILLSANDVTISEDDVNKYIEWSFPRKAMDQLDRNDDAFRQIVENLFVIRSLAKLGEKETEGQEKVKWRTELSNQRYLMELFFENHTLRKLENTDFEGLAYEYYLANQDMFESEEERRAAHILIKPVDGDETALAKANDLKKRLENGEDFANLAVQYSDDEGSSKQGGDLGFFNRQKMVPEFADAVFESNDKNGIVGPVRTKFGFHLIKLTAVEPSATKDFSVVRQEIVEQLRKSSKARLRNDILLSLRSIAASAADKELLAELIKNYRN